MYLSYLSVAFIFQSRRHVGLALWQSCKCSTVESETSRALCLISIEQDDLPQSRLTRRTAIHQLLFEHEYMGFCVDIMPRRIENLI